MVDVYRSDPNSTWTHLPARNIIALARPPLGGSLDCLYLMYVENNPSTESSRPDVSSKVFRYHEIKNAPSDFVHDFQVSPPQGRGLLWQEDGDSGGMDSHIVVSTNSGTSKAIQVWQQVVKPLLDLYGRTEGKDFVLHVTTSETSVSYFTRNVLLPRANAGVTQSVMLLSGDGGIVDILNGLLTSPRDPVKYMKPDITLLPLGTGNALAHSSGITADKTLGLRAWANGRPKELPHLQITFSPGARTLYDEAREEQPLPVNEHNTPTAYGAVVCSWAFHAALVADSDTAEYRKYGAERFKMAAKENLYPSDGSVPHVYKARIRSMIRRESGEHWTEIGREEHMYVLATLVSTLEEGFTISPASKPLDGKLRLVHFGAMSAEDAMAAMGGAYQGGKHVQDARIGYEEIDGLRIDFLEDDARWRRVCIDGKIIRVEQGGFVEVRTASQGVLDLITFA